MLIINLTAVVLTLFDKAAAKKYPSGRIRERTLMIVSALGGSAAMFITMRIIRHKTRRLKFMLGIPVIFILQLAAAALCLWLRLSYEV